MARWKVVLMLVLSVGFLAIFALVPVGKWSFKFWFGAAIFGGATVMFLISLAKPMSLELDAEGFTYAGGLMKTRRIAWRDIESFFVWKPPRGTKMVAYKYREGARPSSLIEKMNRLVGVDGSLPNFFTLKPQALVEKLETYRLRAVR